MLHYSRNTHPLLIGKVPQFLGFNWQNTSTDVIDLVRWLYVEGRAIALGTYDHTTPTQAGEKSTRNASRWQSAQLIVIDVDDSPEWDLERIKALEFVQRHSLAVVPSSSHSHAHNKVHILFALMQPVQDTEMYRQSALWVADQMPFPVDTSTTSPFYPIYGTAFRHEDFIHHDRRLDDGLVWVNEDYKPIVLHIALSERIASGAYKPQGSNPDEMQATRPDDADELSARAVAHYEAPLHKQLSVTLDALKWALHSEWGEGTREERLTTIMSAFMGSPDQAVLNQFLTYSSPRWDVSTQKEVLSTWWAKHSIRLDNPVTVATLFYQARLRGWLAYSDVELSNTTPIYSEEIGDWLVNQPELPTRLLIKSGTGTGKTQGAIRLYRHMKAKRALFFAPSVKLCVALSNSLAKAGIENTLYIENNKTKDRETLRNADVLVTTLQTFGVKLLASGVDVSGYDLVVFDESDELFSSFVRSGLGGGLGAPSHVNKEQARYGMDTLSEIFMYAKQVLLLDGTATDLSRHIMESLTDQPCGIYENTYVRDKAPVTMVNQLNAIRIQIITALSEKKNIVVACDTKAEASLIETMIRITQVCEPEEIIRITSDTVTDKRVMQFFSDVEAGAKQYRCVIYSSAMGSGVSIVDTKPDLVFLLGTYLTPRRWLQMLNRYRQQGAVVAYVTPREKLYSDTVDERFQRLQDVLNREAELANLPLHDRQPIAKIVAEGALIAVQDDYAQNRSVKTFFARLLREDGRTITYEDSENFKSVLIQQARMIVKEQKLDVLKTWRLAEPIKRGDTIPKDMTSDDLARALVHGIVRTEFGDNADTSGMEDEELAGLALDMRPKRRLIENLVNPEKIMNSTLGELQDARKEVTAVRAYFSRIELVTLVQEFFPSWDGQYTDDVLEDNAKLFIKEVGKRRMVYDLIASSYNAYEAVVDRYGEPVEQARRLASTILRSIGLSLRRKNGERINKTEKRERVTYVGDRDRLIQYMTLKGYTPEQIDRLKDFNRSAFKGFHENTIKTSEQYKRLKADDKREVLTTLSLLEATYDSAVVLQTSQYL